MKTMFLPFVFDKAVSCITPVPKDFPKDLGKLERLHKRLGFIFPEVACIGNVEGGAVAMRRVVGRIGIAASAKPQHVILGAQNR